MAGEMKLRITVDDKGSVAINNVRQQIGKLAKDSAAASAAMSSFKTAMGGLISAAAVMGLVRLGKEAMDTMDRIDELSQQTGVAAESIQVFGHAGRLSGIDMDAMAKSMGKLSKTMYEAAAGSDGAKGAFDTLGINVKEADGNLRTLDEVMLDVADRFEKMPDGTQKSALAMKIFGKSGAELIPFLNQGREGLEAMRKEMEALGMVIDGKAIRQAGELNDRMDLLGMAMKAGVMKVMVEMLPVIENLVTSFGSMVKEGDLVNQWAQNTGSFMKIIASAVLGVAQAFDILGTSIGEALARGQQAYEKSSWLSKLTGLASIKAGVAGFAGGLNDPNSALAQKSASYGKIWDSMWGDKPGNMLALPGRARGGGGSPDDKGAQSRASQIASLTESWAAKMVTLGTDMVSLYQDDLTKAIIDIEAKAAAMYAEADKAARTHGVTLDTSVIGKWKEAMITNAEYQAEMKNTETILNAMAATAEKQAASEGARKEASASWAIAEASAMAEIQKGYIDLAVTMGKLSETDAIEAKYTLELAIIQAEWERLAVLSEIAVTEEDLFKITERAYALKLKENQLDAQKGLSIASVKQVDKFGEDIAGALNNALTDLFFDPAKFSWENFWNDLRWVAAKAMADMVTDWLKAQMKMTSGGSTSGGGCFGNLFNSLFGGGGGSSMWSGIELPAYGYHTGGIAGEGSPSRSLPASLIASAPRLHGGLFPGEFPAVLKRGEGVFTPGQMRGMGGTTNNITINAMDSASFARFARANRRTLADQTVSASRDNHPVRRR